MHKWEKAFRENRNKYGGQNPSFSSTLLDEIYRSVCESDTNKHEDLKFYGETISPKKQSKGLGGVKSGRAIEEDKEMAALRRACLIEKWMDHKVSQNVTTIQHGRQNLTEFGRKSQLDRDLDQDALFFSSTSCSSDSSSGGFSSSDTESFYGARSRASSLAPQRPKPVKTSVSAQSEKTGKTERTLFYEQSELHLFGDYHCSSSTEDTPRLEESIFKSKSRALKIYNNLKKVKQPISPGGKLANFINSLFTTGNAKKSKISSSSSSIVGHCDEERKLKSAQASSTCSSASSFSRSCLSKNSPSTREKLRNGVKRSVRFYPVSVIVDENCRPCGHKCLYQEEEGEVPSSLMSVSLPTAWKIGKSPSKKIGDELKFQAMDKSRRVEEVAREFLKDYQKNQKKNGKFLEDEEDDDYDDDDAASYSSSDLFELDHLSVIGKDRYCQELPVYETTHVDTNRAIANGLIM